MAKKTLMIPLNSGKKVKVKAEVYGPLAVHRGVKGDDDGWVITHMATRLAIRQGGDTYRLKRDAVGMCKKLIPLADWSFTTARGFEDIWTVRTLNAVKKALAS